MSSQTKIVILRMKTIIYTIIIIALVLFVITMAWFMFGSKEAKKETTETKTHSTTTYIPGRYTATLTVNATPLDIIVTVNESEISSIEFYNLSKSITASYPLMQPALEKLTTQILTSQSTDNITYDEKMKYTQQALIETINRALKKARP